MRIRIINKNNKAFTLIEVLLSIAISSIIIIVAFSVFHAGSISWEKIEEKADVNQNARIVMETIISDIRRCNKADVISDERIKLHFGEFEIVEYYLEGTNVFREKNTGKNQVAYNIQKLKFTNNEGVITLLIEGKYNDQKMDLKSSAKPRGI